MSSEGSGPPKLSKWQIFGPVGTWVGVLLTTIGVGVAILALFLNYSSSDSSSNSTDAGDSPSSGSSVPSPNEPVGDEPLESVTPISVGECVDTNLESAACTTSGSWLVVAQQGCQKDTQDHLAFLGLEPPAGKLDLKVGGGSTQCLITPGTLASKAGGNASDVGRLMEGEPADMLHVCLMNDVEVACSSRHTVEFVTDWAASTGLETVDDPCQPAAARYGARDFADPLDSFDVVLLTTEAPPRFACAIRSSEVLSESLAGPG